MMTVKCEISLDWIEDGSIDEIIQDRIITETVAAVKISIQKQIDSMAVDILNTRVNAMLDQIWIDFIEKRVNLTDKYGDVVETHDSIKDMLKARLDNFINQRVDKDGKPFTGNSCGYNSKPKIEWLLEDISKKHTDNFIKQIQQDFELKLKQQFNAALKDKISESMLKTVNVAQLLANS